MHEFLNSIADAYLRDPDLRTYTFVFPNVRSKRYFNEYLAGRLGVEPREVSSLCLTLTQLFEKGSGMKMASTERLLFMLYRAYCNVRGRQGLEAEPFARFRFWAQMILNDFNDVDKYLADPKELFRNARDYKKIQSFYLTPAQEEIIRTYWGSDPYWQGALKNRDEAAELPFWNHVSMKGEPERRFTQLWAVLGEVYDEFRRLLAVGNECYPGMAYRAVAESVMLGNDLPFKPRLFVFIGFNRLTHSEHALFRQLARRRLAHFYWDYDAALMKHRQANTAGRFISTYAEEFRACNPSVEFPPHPVRHSVDVIAVPSGVAQTKVIAGYLHGDDTALVLADSELLVPTVASIPEEYEHVNVTMGYPMRFSALAQLFSLLTAMQLRARFDSAGVPTFFHDDIVALTSHPAVQAAFPRECGALIQFMRDNYLFNLPLNRLTSDFDALRPLLGSVGRNASVGEVADYIRCFADYAVNTGMVNGIDRECADDLRTLTDRIAACAEEFGVEADRRTLFDMVENSLNERTLPLEGESFEAMQVMGILETRALGFPNVVMLSMNDEVFPGTAASHSFIPESLRRAYGLPTRDHLEADSAYHFYRILSHARHLTVVYDARCGGLRTGEVSRYVTQLIYGGFPGVEVNVYLGEFSPPKSGRSALIPDGYTMAKGPFAAALDRFRDSSRLAAYRLSASDLKEYLNCPLQFFLTKINDINPPEPDSEETGAADHGNVVHEVAERVYGFFARRGGDVTRDDLDSLVAGGFNNLLERELVRAVNIHLVHYPRKVDGKENPMLEKFPLDEKNSLYADALRLSLHTMFAREQTPFAVVGTEVPVEFCWQVSDSLAVNFKMVIDRLDRIVEGNTDVYRIIDYKTGADKTDFPSVESLFEIGNPSQRKAVFQLMVYCAAYLSNHPELDARQLRPQIFKLKNMNDEGFSLLKLGSQRSGVEIESYAQVCDEFEMRLKEMFEEIFNVGKPIERASDPECCKYCNFLMLCRKY